MEIDPYIKLAKESLFYYIKYKRKMEKSDTLAKELLEEKAGVFVSIKKQGNLRGCIGTIQATTESIADEIIQNVISAGIRDPRFYPIQEIELDQLSFSVDILKKAIPIKDKSELNPKKFGIIVSYHQRKALLLPNLEGIKSIDDQINIALKKAHIQPNSDYRIEKFEVIRHE